MTRQIFVKYCSDPNGHSPKDCPDRYYEDPEDVEELKQNLKNMDIELDDEELAVKIHDGTLGELL